MAFGFWEAILSFLTRQIGLRTDAADAAGSLHAKTADIKTYLTNTVVATEFPKVQKPRGPVSGVGSYGINSTTYVTVLNLTGVKGELIAVGATGGSAAGAPTVKITVDGYAVAEATGLADTAMQYPDEKFFLSGGLVKTAGGISHGRISFKQSLKIEAKIANYGGTVYWLYILE